MLFLTQLVVCVRCVLCASQFSKFVVKEVLDVISDKRAIMRTSVFGLLDAWVEHNGVTNAACLDKVRVNSISYPATYAVSVSIGIHLLSASLLPLRCVRQVLHASPEVLQGLTGRTELLEWIGKHVANAVSTPGQSIPPASLAALCPTVVQCLLSKDHTSRAASQKLIGYGDDPGGCWWRPNKGCVPFSAAAVAESILHFHGVSALECLFSQEHHSRVRRQHRHATDPGPEARGTAVCTRAHQGGSG